MLSYAPATMADPVAVVVDYGKLAKRLEALRKAKHWSQQDLADETGVSQTTISKMQRGESYTLENLLLVAPRLGETVIEFLRDSVSCPEALGEPRTRQEPAEGSVPLAEHVAALRALRKEIEALGGGAGGDRLSQAHLDQLGKDARGENGEPTPPVRPGSGTGRTKGRGHGRSGGQR